MFPLILFLELLNPFQSSLHPKHSTKSFLARSPVTSGRLFPVAGSDSCYSDLYAMFDKIDYSSLETCLLWPLRYPLTWFSSYLSHHSFSISFAGSSSSSAPKCETSCLPTRAPGGQSQSIPGVYLQPRLLLQPRTYASNCLRSLPKNPIGVWIFSANPSIATVFPIAINDNVPCYL